MKNFIKRNLIRIKKCERVEKNPNNPDWKDADHWRVVLSIGKKGDCRQMTTYFSMGYGHKGKEPKAEDILDCLASDSSGVNQDFEDWAADLGYDSDSRKAERTYRVCIEQARKLELFLNYEQYEELLYDTERL